MTQLLAVCSTAYPTMTLTDEFVALWKKMLVDVDAELASNNLKQHIMTNRFPPTIAEIAKRPEKSFYDNYRLETQEHVLMLEESHKKAVPMPEHIRKDLIGHD